MARIVVITHEYDDFSSRNYLIEGLSSTGGELGHEVVVTAGTPPGTSGDIAILHVDCSVVEEAYLDYAKRFPVVLNAGTRDIRKSAISRVLVTRGDDWCGPVVVKSDLNCGGLPERIHNRVAARMGHAAAHAGAKLFERYEVLDSQALVRRRVWKDPNLVVERFIPECDERGFWLPDVGVFRRQRALQPLLRAAGYREGVRDYVQRTSAGAGRIARDARAARI